MLTIQLDANSFGLPVPDALPTATHPIHPGLEQCTELWQWFGVAVMAYGASTKLLYVGPGQYQ